MPIRRPSSRPAPLALALAAALAAATATAQATPQPSNAQGLYSVARPTWLLLGGALDDRGREALGTSALGRGAPAGMENDFRRLETGTRVRIEEVRAFQYPPAYTGQATRVTVIDGAQRGRAGWLTTQLAATRAGLRAPDLGGLLAPAAPDAERPATATRATAPPSGATSPPGTTTTRSGAARIHLRSGRVLNAPSFEERGSQLVIGQPGIEIIVDRADVVRIEPARR